jgi:uncharacterized membrane protein
MASERPVYDIADEWLRRPDVWSGVVLGAWAATRSFGPSLMPRATAHQAMVSGASAAVGFAVGNATYGIVGSGLDVDRQVTAFALTGATGIGTRIILPPRNDEDLVRATARAMGEGLAAGSTACAAVALVRRSQRPVRTAALLAAGGAAAGGVAVARSVRDQRSRRDDVDPPPPRPLPAVAQSATVAGVLAAAVNGYRRSGRGAARMLQRRFGVGPDVGAVGGRAVATAVWGAVIVAFADTFVRGMALYDRVVDPGYDEPPATPARSGNHGSAVSFSRTGRQGRRFILDVPTTDEIEQVMGTPAVAEPVRVFVGFDAARAAEDRVALALAELERTGAYDRSILVVGSPAGTGYTNPVVFEAVDHLALGDSAGVAVQYERLPSLLCLHRVGWGGQHYRLLLEGIHKALQERPPGRRPRVVAYGESLGAWAGQNAFLHEGVVGMDDLGVERALWAGTPFYSGWMRSTVQRSTDPDVPPGSVVAVNGVEELRTLDADARRRVRVVLLDHQNDPVHKLSLDLLVRRPGWLGDERPPQVPERQRYLPVITAIQTIVDAVNATNQVPGVFRATGHDYRLDLPAMALEVYGLPRPSDEQWDRLLVHLQQHEARRAAAFKLSRVDETVDEEVEAVAAATVGAVRA